MFWRGWSGLGSANMISCQVRVLAALMSEQKILLVGSRWGQISSCAHALLALLYPLAWQHIFIPVLPSSKLSYACAPMPFVLGVLSSDLKTLQKEPVDSLLYVSCLPPSRSLHPTCLQACTSLTSYQLTFYPLTSLLPSHLRTLSSPTLLVGQASALVDLEY